MRLLVAAAFPMMVHAQSNLGTVSITGDQLGSGLMAVEETPKARSSVTKVAIEQNVGTANPYQNLSLLPGVYTYNHDASGLFGGGLTMRGFNSDQLGFTIDGAPVDLTPSTVKLQMRLEGSSTLKVDAAATITNAAAGAEVHLTRAGDQAVSESERVQGSEDFRADRYLRIDHRVGILDENYKPG